MAWKFTNETSVSKQICQRLRLEIVNGKYEKGGTFPAVRTIAIEAAVNPNTMQKSLSILENEGLLTTRGTVGRFVTDDEEIIDATRKKLQDAYIKKVLNDASDLGISKETLIELLQNKEG